MITQFFEKCRPEFYFHGAGLAKDKDTGRRVWRLNLVLTLKAEEVLSCDDIIRNNYEAIETRGNAVEELKIGGIVPAQTVEFFALAEHKNSVLRLPGCDLTDLRMTRSEDLTELWLKLEAENSNLLHSFVKDFAFQRLWVEFAPTQITMPVVAVTLTKAKI